jgi:hypothetical protein
MVRNFDHLMIVVHDLERAQRFFGILGFKEAISVVIAGEPFASYMGCPRSRPVMPPSCWSTPRRGPKFSSCMTAIRRASPIRISTICTRSGSTLSASLSRISRVEVRKIRENGFETRSGILDFHSRKLVFLEGPEGVTVGGDGRALAMALRSRQESGAGGRASAN